MFEETGLIISSGEGRFQWIIDDFLSRVYETYHNHDSPDFSFSGTSCSLGISWNNERSNLSLSIRSKSSPVVPFKVEFGMNTGYRGKLETRTGETNNYGYFSVFAWMSCSELLNRRCEILHNGSLTVFCELRRLDVEDESGQESNVPSKETVTKENEASESDSDEEGAILGGKILRKLRKDLKSLLDSGEDYDVTIKVQGKEFRALRGILRARSPVFKSMFSHETMEKQSGVVAIEDCDPVTFPDFLNYLYTGSTKHICDENVCQLYTAADKYGVEELKEECAAFMKNNLSVGKFCDIITLAVRHNETELVDSATEYFCANAMEITQTVKWQAFLHDNTTMGNELVVKFISSVKR